MKKRRAKGQGGQKPDGTWSGSITLGGKRRWLYGKTHAEVQVKLARLRADHDKGLPTDPPREKVGAFLKRWQEHEARVSVRPSTYRLYTGLIQTHVTRQREDGSWTGIGSIRLARLSPGDVKALLAEAEAQGKTPRLRQLMFAVLHRAFQTALKEGIVPRNVLDAVTRPRVARKEMKVLTAAQVGTFLKVASGHRLEALYILALTRGMRQGEMFGLQWDDLDLDAKTLSIQRQLTDGNGHPTLAEPKTARGRRRLDLPTMLVDALKAHRTRMLAEGHYQAGGLIFVDTQGHPLRASNVARNSFIPLLVKAGLATEDPETKQVTRRAIRFHDLRHTCATLALASGVPAKVVQEMLGHSTISVTLDLYGHVLPGMMHDEGGGADRRGRHRCRRRAGVTPEGSGSEGRRLEP